MILYHNDHLGTPQKMTDPSGAVVWSAKYSSFGEAHVDPASTVVNNLRFPGQYEDLETGLHYNFHRYYDTEIGRYLRVDPIGLWGEDVNLFAYSFSNPTKFVDPEGLECGSWWNDWLVDDRPDGFDFSECCREHDNCYGNECLKNRKQCDDEFYECMRRTCDFRYLSNGKCYEWASKYWDAVDRMGGGAFDDAREEGCCYY